MNEKPQRLAPRTKLLEAAPLSPFGEDEGSEGKESTMKYADLDACNFRPADLCLG